MNDFKRCPYCNEEIKIAAKKCKHCGEWFDKDKHVKTEIFQSSGSNITENHYKNANLELEQKTLVKKNRDQVDSEPLQSKKNQNLLRSGAKNSKKAITGKYIIVLLILLIIISAISILVNSPSNQLQTANYTIPVLGMQFIYLEPASFEMGSNNDDSYIDEIPTRSVKISNGYWIGKHEVTQNEYRFIMGTNPSEFKDGNKPVEQINWYDAVKFCERLTAREREAGRLPANYEYRLPTEAEWEFAARGGIKKHSYKYSGSDNIDSVAWHSSNSGNKPHEVGTKLGNELGLHDMSGNAWEWCRDWYGRYDRWDSTDPTGAASGSGRVVRGGSWDAKNWNCRVSARLCVSPDNKAGDLGFRVVLILGRGQPLIKK